MLRVNAGTTNKYCDGVSRRSFLQIGMAGMGALSLPQILKAKEAAQQAGGEKKDTAVILLWLDGGPGHMDMYDMKPEAPEDYRGIWRPIRTNVSGFDLTEMYPLQAKVADRFSIVRSLHHDTGDHFTGGHWMLTGRGEVSGASNAGKYPFIGSIATKMVGSRQPGMPANVAIPYAMSIGLRPGYFGGNYLGVQDNPFETVSDANSDRFAVQNINLPTGLNIKRLENRRALLSQFDTLRQEADQSGMMSAMNRFEQNAFEMVTGPREKRSTFKAKTPSSAIATAASVGDKARCWPGGWSKPGQLL